MPQHKKKKREDFVVNKDVKSNHEILRRNLKNSPAKTILRHANSQNFRQRIKNCTEWTHLLSKRRLLLIKYVYTLYR